MSWSGLVLGRRGGQWRIVAVDDEALNPLRNADLTACDGVPADAWADDRLKQFYTSPEVEARKERAAWQLFVDEHNPFLPRPEECVFSTPTGETVVHRLEWRDCNLKAVKSRIEALAPRPQAGVGLAPVEKGYWIGLEDLVDAEDVTSSVEQSAAALRQADWVVLDLRGNGGGNTEFSNRILTALMGKERVAAARPDYPCGNSYYRLTRGNIDRFKHYRDERKARGLDARSMDRWITTLETARMLGLSLWPLHRRYHAVFDPPIDFERLPAPTMKGRLYVITDSRCFSSCLLAVDLARRVGAIQLGYSTDRMNRYMEVREAALPSGRGRFSTLMKMVEGVPDFGPYQPHHPYDGDLADDEALKTWVISLATASD